MLDGVAVSQGPGFIIVGALLPLVNLCMTIVKTKTICKLDIFLYSFR